MSSNEADQLAFRLIVTKYYQGTASLLMLTSRTNTTPEIQYFNVVYFINHYVFR